MLQNKNYLKNYLLYVNLLSEKNFFFIVKILDNIYIKLFKIKFSFLLKKYKLFFFIFKGESYYFYFKNNQFLTSLILLYEFIKIDLFFLNGVIYNNYYLNLNNDNLFNLLNKFLNLNFNLFSLFINYIFSIIICIYFFLLKFFILLRKIC